MSDNGGETGRGWKPAGDREFGVIVKLAVILGMSGWDEMVPGDVRQPGAPAYFEIIRAAR